MRDATRIIRSTLAPAVPGEPLHSGPVFAGPFHTPGEIAQAPYSYARSHNPTWTELEHALALMESAGEFEATALVFASGIAAIAAVFGAVLRPGDIAVLPTNSYYTARMLMKEYFAEMGVTVRLAPTAGDAQGEYLDGARLLWLETPSNPTMDICDIAALCEKAHAAGALVAVDNSTPSPLGQRPLALGADFSVCSDTKSVTGHSDVLMGHVAMRDHALHVKVDRWRTLTGGVVGPMEAWLALRSIATLPLRLERSCANAQRIAEYLTTRPEVLTVLYPGLATHPGHAVAARQMQAFGPVLGFELASQAAAESFLAKAELVTEATSFGGISTTAERRARWGGDAVSGGFIRMSAGCEDVEDLLEDIGRALDGVSDMQRGIEWFERHRPTAFHVTYAENLQSIRQHGLFSANELMRKARVTSSFRSREETLDCDQLGPVTLRDQWPMRRKVLENCLTDISPEHWYELIDEHIFFSLDEKNVQSLLNNYENQVVIEIPTRDLLKLYSRDIYLTPINTGAVEPAYAMRSRNTFHNFDQWCSSGFTDNERKKAALPKELAIRRNHVSIDFTVRGQ